MDGFVRTSRKHHALILFAAMAIPLAVDTAQIELDEIANEPARKASAAVLATASITHWHGRRSTTHLRRTDHSSRSLPSSSPFPSHTKSDSHVPRRAHERSDGNDGRAIHAVP